MLDNVLVFLDRWNIVVWRGFLGGLGKVFLYMMFELSFKGYNKCLLGKRDGKGIVDRE